MGQTMANSPVPPIIIASVIGWPSFILYLMEVLILLTNWKQFKSSFYALFLIRALPNLLNFFSSFLGSRFGQLGFFLQVYLSFPRLLLALLFFLSYYNFHAENLATMFILLNRLTSVLMPFQQDLIWKYLLPVAIALIFLLPLPFTWHIFGLEMFASVNVKSGTFTIDYKHYPGGISNSTYAARSSSAFLIVCAFINLATVVAYSRQKMSEPPNKKGEPSVEFRLTVYAFVTFFAQLFMAVFMIMMSLSSGINASNIFLTNLFYASFYQLPWLNDLTTLAIPAWLMLWASSSIRQLILKKISIFSFKIGFYKLSARLVSKESSTVRSQLTVSNAWSK